MGFQNISKTILISEMKVEYAILNKPLPQSPIILQHVVGLASMSAWGLMLLTANPFLCIQMLL